MYEELIKALRSDAGSQYVRDAADAIEELDAEETRLLLLTSELQDKLMDAEAEVKRLKDSNDELREKQTFIDNWGTRWMTSAKDVPDSAYKHGYADGKSEALTLEKCIDRLHELGWLQEHDRILSQPHWVSVEDELPKSGTHVLACCEVHGINGYRGHYVCDAFHTDKKSISCSYNDDIDEEYDEETDEYYFPVGWWEVVKNWDDYSCVAINDVVTHWMPLPEPPREVQE